MCHKIIIMGLFTNDIINWFNSVCVLRICVQMLVCNIVCM